MNATAAPAAQVIDSVPGTIRLRGESYPRSQRDAFLRRNGEMVYRTRGGHLRAVAAPDRATFIQIGDNGLHDDALNANAEAAAYAEDANRDLDAHSPRLIDAAASLSPAHAELAQLLRDVAAASVAAVEAGVPVAEVVDAQRAALRELEHDRAVDEAQRAACQREADAYAARCTDVGATHPDRPHAHPVDEAHAAARPTLDVATADTIAARGYHDTPAEGGDQRRCDDDCTAAQVGLTHRHEPDGTIVASGTGGSSDAGRAHSATTPSALAHRTDLHSPGMSNYDAAMAGLAASSPNPARS